MKNSALKTAVLILLLSLVAPCVFAQSYRTFVESSTLDNQIISKLGNIWIVSIGESYSWNRAIEKSLRTAFSNKEKKVVLTTDKIDISDLQESTIDKLGEIIRDDLSRYVLYVQMGDLYTFTYGEGIGRIEFVLRLQDRHNGQIVMMAETSTEADKNDMLSLNATREAALKSMAEAFVAEYISYER